MDLNAAAAAAGQKPDSANPEEMLAPPPQAHVEREKDITDTLELAEDTRNLSLDPTVKQAQTKDGAGPSYVSADAVKQRAHHRSAPKQPPPPTPNATNGNTNATNGDSYPSPQLAPAQSVHSSSSTPRIEVPLGAAFGSSPRSRAKSGSIGTSNGNSGAPVIPEFDLSKPRSSRIQHPAGGAAHFPSSPSGNPPATPTQPRATNGANGVSVPPSPATSVPGGIFTPIQAKQASTPTQTPKQTPTQPIAANQAAGAAPAAAGVAQAPVYAPSSSSSNGQDPSSRLQPLSSRTTVASDSTKLRQRPSAATTANNGQVNGTNEARAVASGSQTPTTVSKQPPPPADVDVDNPLAVSSQQVQRGQVDEKGPQPDLVPSKDLDMSNITTKPPPLLPQMPTYRGWREVGHFESDDVMTAEDYQYDLTSKSSFFDTQLPSKLFGEWYHNVGWLAIGAFFSWFWGYFYFSLGPVFFVVLVCSVFYRSSVRKYREQIREEAQREFSIKQIETDYETIDWFNLMVEKFWYYLEPSISQIVCEQINATLVTLPVPDFIMKLWIDTFTAGTKPFRVNRVKTLQGTADDVVVMDWEFSYIPNSLVDLSAKQLKSTVNEKITVKTSLFGVTIPVTVSDVSCRAIVRVRVRMMESFPHIETVNVSLLQPPNFDFVCRLFGDTCFNFEVLDFPGIFPFINEMVTKYVGPMVYAPMSYQLNIQQLLAGNALDSAIGVLCITANYGKDIRAIASINNTMDPYLTFCFDKRKVLAKTKTIMDTSNPKWNQTFYIPVKSLADPLVVQLFDYNDFRSDKLEGIVQMDLEFLEKDPVQQNVNQTITRNTKPVGTLNFDLQYFKCEEATMGPDGAITPPPDLNTGIARINVAEARHLKLDEKEKPPNVQALVYLDNELVDESEFVKSATPGWNMIDEKIVSSRSKAKLKVVLKDKSGKKLGVVSKYLNEYIDASQVQQSWFSLASGGEVRIEVQWKPVELDIGDPISFTPPIGAVRVSIDRAEDLRNLETIGKIDPYVRVFVNGVYKTRTRAFNGNLNPSWNEVHYVTVSSANQKLTIEVMDVERHSPDRTLGQFDVQLNEIIQRDEKGQYVEHQDTTKRVSKLIHKKGVKGQVTYSLSFFPCLPVKTLQDIRDDEWEKQHEAEQRERTQKRKQEMDDIKEQINHHHGHKKHVLQRRLARMEKLGGGADDAAEDEALNIDGGSSDSGKLALSLDELIDFKSGVFVFEVLGADVPKKSSYVQFFFDSHGYSDWTSPKLSKASKRKKRGNAPEGALGTGDVVITDLDWSQCTIRIAAKDDNNIAEKCDCETSIPALQLLKNSYDQPETLQLSGSNGQGTVQVQCQWIPLVYENGVPPQDSKDNQGELTIQILKGNGLPSADSNGKSDPFVQLYLDSDKKHFFKTHTKKRTLDPVWNETTTVELGNMYDTEIRVMCWDWDMADENDLLGTGLIKLSEANFKENSSVDVETPLVGESGEDAGTVYFKLSFKPKKIIQVRANSDTTIGDAFVVAKGGATVVKGVGKGVGFVGKNVGKGALLGLGGGAKILGGGFKGIKHLGHHDKKDADDSG
ncbi:hypothetical protein DIURU_004012 [Diutina rugosa]|uniref:Tricalbin n=1 Tax=Diutina rugosa TaxID=5481 RepID=A0A642UQS1_DIURU|nr:uncharacterized protein DIURU_004012 [Diutina rugosa]KAA8899971.1 hypothetical protein DIURU_004012 [Diutina rugosa]